VSQLEHALQARVRVEQAIGVLAERHRIKPRQAFEQLRAAARNRGRKVIDIASDVVASASNPLLQLPEELSRPRTAPRRPTRQPNGA
jgi:AmiR/NasT family two-component response regulator